MNLSDLKPAPFNPREIEAAAIKGLGTSIAEFGDIGGIVWNRRNGYLVAGHQRLKVLTEEGYELLHRVSGDLWWLEHPHEFGDYGDTFPVRVVDWPDDKHKAAMVAANSALLAGEFIDDQLVDMVDELKESDLASLIEPLRLEELVDDMRPPVEVQQDEVPEPPKEPVTRPGDLWTMGDHRVLCGDSTKGEDMERVVDSGKAVVCLTDPPYAVGLDYGEQEDSVENLRRLIAGYLPLVQERCQRVIVTPGVTRQWLYPEPTWVLCWFYAGGQHYTTWGFNCWQPILVYGKCPYLAAGRGARPDAVDMNTPSGLAKELGHPCPKPVKFWCWLMERVSNNEDIVLDPFLGSGTTLIAAHQLGRRCYGIEIEPRYVDVICQRFLNLTGESPIRESDGARFADLIACST